MVYVASDELASEGMTVTEDAPLTDAERLKAEVESTLTNALTSTQDALGSVRDAAAGVEPTTELARADAFLVEASGALQMAIQETRTPISPEAARIKQLEDELDEAKKQNAQVGPVAPSVPKRHDVRPPDESRRPRGMQRFSEGHTPLPEGEPDFVSSVPAPFSGFEPGQGEGRLAQAQVTGQGPSASDALARQQAIKDRAALDAIREKQGLPPGGPSAS